MDLERNGIDEETELAERRHPTEHGQLTQLGVNGTQRSARGTGEHDVYARRRRPGRTAAFGGSGELSPRPIRAYTARIGTASRDYHRIRA